MSESGVSFPPEQRWIHVLRNVGSEEQPVRWEGLDFIEATDLERFRNAGWDELLLISDFFIRILLRMEKDNEFIADWQGHAGGRGNQKAFLFQRTTDVCTKWANRLNLIAEHHLRAGTQPSMTMQLPRSLYRSREPLDFLATEGVGFDAKIGLLSALTRVAIAHSSILQLVALSERDGLPGTTQATISWINSVSVCLMVAGYHGTPALAALKSCVLARIEKIADDALSHYEPEVAEMFRESRGSGSTDRRIVVVDPQLALDICVIRTVAAVCRATRSDSDEALREVITWLAEGHRILDGPSQHCVDLDHADLSRAESWFRPNFGQTWPSCVADAEEIARAFLTIMSVRSDWKDLPKLLGNSGEFIDVATQKDVIRFRIPGFPVQPSRVGSSDPTMEAAFRKHPLLIWTLFPSTGSSNARRFWKDGVYGRMFSVLDHIAATFGNRAAPEFVSPWIPRLGSSDKGQTTPDDVVSTLFPELPTSGAHSVAAMAGPVFAAWLGGSSC